MSSFPPSARPSSSSSSNAQQSDAHNQQERKSKKPITSYFSGSAETHPWSSKAPDAASGAAKGSSTFNKPNDDDAAGAASSTTAKSASSSSMAVSGSDTLKANKKKTKKTQRPRGTSSDTLETKAKKQHVDPESDAPASVQQLPESYTAKTLFDMCNWTLGGKWTCVFCGKSEVNKSRLLPHMLHWHCDSVNGLIDMVEASVIGECRGKLQQRLMQEIAERKEKKKGSLSGTQQKAERKPVQSQSATGSSTNAAAAASKSKSVATTIVSEPLGHSSALPSAPRKDSVGSTDNAAASSGMSLKERYQRKMLDFLTGAIINVSLPIAVCEESWPYEMFNAGIEFGTKLANEALSTHKARVDDPDIDPNWRVPRSTLAEATYRECQRIVQSEVEMMSRRSNMLAFSCRTEDISDPLYIAELRGGARAMPLELIHVGKGKADAPVEIAPSLSKLARESDFLYTVLSDCDDETMFQAIGDICNKENLVHVFCQGKALSLLCSDLTEDVFTVCFEKANAIISFLVRFPFIRHLVHKASSRKVFRPIPAFKASYVHALGRVLEYKMILHGLILDEDYLKFKEEQTPEVVADFDVVEAIIRDKAFWIELRSYCMVCVPIAEAVELIGEHDLRARDANRLWKAVRSRVNDALQANITPSLSPEIRSRVLEVFDARHARSRSALFDLAELLHDGSWSETDQSSEERLVLDTREILKTVLRRQLDMSSAATSAERAALFANRWAKVNAEFETYLKDRKIVPSTESHSLASRYERLKDMPCTAFNINRLRDVYALVRTPAVGLSGVNSTADDLAMARLVVRMRTLTEETSPGFVSTGDILTLATTTTTSSLDTLTLAIKRVVQWGEEVSSAFSVVANTLQRPSRGSIVVEFPSQDSFESATDDPLS